MNNEQNMCFSCSLFEKQISWNKKNIFLQEEAKFVENIDNQTIFKKIYNEWSFEVKFFAQKKHKDLAIVCIRDSHEILKHLINEIKQNKLLEIVDFLLVEDRPSDDTNLNLCISNKITNIKILNSENEFNFSMLNNIGAMFGKFFNYENIILWNSDLWPKEQKDLVTVLKKHKRDKSDISGTKLLYPIVSLNEKYAKQNIKLLGRQDDFKYQGTVQFGGSFFYKNVNTKLIEHHHAFRFYDQYFHHVNCDKPEIYLTGAFTIIKTESFFEVGGLNPSLANESQDVDFCIKAFLLEKKIMYYGKDVTFFHDESINRWQLNNKMEPQIVSDFVIFQKLCPFTAYENKIKNYV